MTVAAFARRLLTRWRGRPIDAVRCARCGALWSRELVTYWGSVRGTEFEPGEPSCIAYAGDRRCAGALIDVRAPRSQVRSIELTYL